MIHATSEELKMPQKLFNIKFKSFPRQNHPKKPINRETHHHKRKSRSSRRTCRHDDTPTHISSLSRVEWPAFSYFNLHDVDVGHRAWLCACTCVNIFPRHTHTSSDFDVVAAKYKIYSSCRYTTIASSSSVPFNARFIA